MLENTATKKRQKIKEVEGFIIKFYDARSLLWKRLFMI